MSKLERIAVIGAGTMGNGIAQTFASYETEVQLVDVNEAVSQTQEARDAAMQPGFREGYEASYATLDKLLSELGVGS